MMKSGWDSKLSLIHILALTTGFRLGEKSPAAADAMSGRRLSVRRIISVSSSDFPIDVYKRQAL